MIELGLLPGAGSVASAVKAVQKSRKLRQAWGATMQAGHLSQVQTYGTFATRKTDPLADWLARKI